VTGVLGAEMIAAVTDKDYFKTEDIGPTSDNTMVGVLAYRNDQKVVVNNF
jgi:hypothetical protein